MHNASMKFPFYFPITDRIFARKIAALFVKNECNMARAVEELAPGLANPYAVSVKLMTEPAVRYEIGVIMDRVERKEGRAETFLKKMWEWLEAPPDGTKETEENRRTAARIMAKGYIREKGQVEEDDKKPMIIQGLGDGIENLTGETPVAAETDPKKVV